MRIDVKETTVYKFNELSEDARQTALERMADINVDCDWWQFTYEDAETVKLKLTGFDIDRGSYCKGTFIENADDTAQAIIDNHGKDCETFKTAEVYIADSKAIGKQFPVDYDEDGFDNNEQGREDEQADRDDEFLHDILEDYRIMLQKEYEYMTSEEAIIETILANEYEFTEDGKMY